MNKLTTTTLIALLVALIAAALPTKVEAAPINPTGTTSGHVVTLSVDEVPSTPSFIGAFSSANSVKASIVPVFVEKVRKVKHTNEAAVTPNSAPSNITIFEDGGWINNDTGETGCNPGGLCNENEDGAIIFEDGSWLMPDGSSGCFPWGGCNIDYCSLPDHDEAYCTGNE